MNAEAPSGRPLILLTNDDGIESPGLRAAVEAVMDLGDLMIIAPLQQQSSMSRSLWGDRDDRLHPREYVAGGRSVPAYACNGAPALAVLHGFHALCSKRRPALLVSGINYGENLGHNVTLSGTVGAGLEAASLGVPALAMSLQTDIAFHYHHGDVDWTAARHFTRLFAQRMLVSRLPEDVDVLSVNVPRSATAETPWRVTRLSRRSYFTIRMETPHAGSLVRDGKVGVFLGRDSVEAGSDIRTVAFDEEVSVTPLSLDITSRAPRAAVELVLQGAAK